MSRNARGYTGAVLVARSVGFGVMHGAVLGVAAFALVTVYPWDWDLGGFIAFALVAAVVGAMVGAVVGLLCGTVLVVAGPVAIGDRRSVRRLARVAAGSPFVLLAALASENGAEGWELSGWLWWLVVAAMACATAAAIGPHVVGGRADPLAPGHSCFRHCHLTRGHLTRGALPG
jgi:hypothetical protein